MKDFEQDLAELLGDRLRADLDFAYLVYGSLGNVEWQHKEATYGCTFRSAGDLIAKIRDQGESYLDFYCSSPEGVVDEEAAAALATRGWVAEIDPNNWRPEGWKPDA